MNANRGVQSCTKCGRILRRRHDVGNTTAPCRCGGEVIEGRSYAARVQQREQHRVVIGASDVVDVDAILRAQTDAVRPRLREVKRG